MAKIIDQLITDRFAIYNSDCLEVMRDIPTASVGYTIYSPPFAGLFHYSSSERDLSNARTYPEFLQHYLYVVEATHRLTMPGRIVAVHCMDVPSGNTGRDELKDFPGDIIRIHQQLGFEWTARRTIWKEPLRVRNRTLIKALAHKAIVDDSSCCTVAGADYLLTFRKRGKNPEPIAHPCGLTSYAGSQDIPQELLRFRGWEGDQKKNKLSHWIWQQYASSIWGDIRPDRVLPYREAKDDEDEKHLHPLQLDVIDRSLALWSNPGDTVLTPFAGVGSEVYCAVRAGRRGFGVELKPSYYRQMVKNMDCVDSEEPPAQESLLGVDDMDEE